MIYVDDSVQSDDSVQLDHSVQFNSTRFHGDVPPRKRGGLVPLFVPN